MSESLLSSSLSVGELGGGCPVFGGGLSVTVMGILISGVRVRGSLLRACVCRVVVSRGLLRACSLRKSRRKGETVRRIVGANTLASQGLCQYACTTILKTSVAHVVARVTVPLHNQGTSRVGREYWQRLYAVRAYAHQALCEA